MRSTAVPRNPEVNTQSAALPCENQRSHAIYSGPTRSRTPDSELASRGDASAAAAVGRLPPPNAQPATRSSPPRNPQPATRNARKPRRPARSNRPQPLQLRRCERPRLQARIPPKAPNPPICFAGLYYLGPDCSGCIPVVLLRAQPQRAAPAAAPPQLPGARKPADAPGRILLLHHKHWPGEARARAALPDRSEPRFLQRAPPPPTCRTPPARLPHASHAHPAVVLPFCRTHPALIPYRARTPAAVISYSSLPHL